MSSTFIDLFAGIGGFRLAFEQAGCECVFSSENDKFAQQTYYTNFGNWPNGDIRNIPSEDIPNHDILVGGFPCQPFSIAGVSVKNSLGKPHGFDDPDKGDLFFEICRILQDKKPAAFLLENVRNLYSHDNGNTFRTMMKHLHAAGYDVDYGAYNSLSYTPQNRYRIFIAGFLNNVEYRLPDHKNHWSRSVSLHDILDSNVDAKYTLSDKAWQYQIDRKRKHMERGNGFGYGLVPLTDYTKGYTAGYTRTLTARYYKDGSEILIEQKHGNPRRLTPRECARLMGFPESFNIPVSDTQAYKQFGNSVVVPQVVDLAKSLVKELNKDKRGG